MERVRFTKHAEHMLRERGLPRDLVVETVLRPDWTERETEEVWHAFRRVANKVLRALLKNGVLLLGKLSCGEGP